MEACAAFQCHYSGIPEIHESKAVPIILMQGLVLCKAQEAEALPPLSAEQQKILDLAVAGQSIFFTGCAGLPPPFGSLMSLAYTACVM